MAPPQRIAAALAALTGCAFWHCAVAINLAGLPVIEARLVPKTWLVAEARLVPKTGFIAVARLVTEAGLIAEARLVPIAWLLTETRLIAKARLVSITRLVTKARLIAKMRLPVSVCALVVTSIARIGVTAVRMTAIRGSVASRAALPAARFATRAGRLRTRFVLRFQTGNGVCGNCLPGIALDLLQVHSVAP